MPPPCFHRSSYILVKKIFTFDVAHVLLDSRLPVFKCHCHLTKHDVLVVAITQLLTANYEHFKARTFEPDVDVNLDVRIEL